MSFAIVTGADSGFFSFLSQLVSSIRDKVEGRHIPLCIFDLGFSEEQRDWLLINGATLRKFEWPFRNKLSLAEQLTVMRSTTPDYFPGHDGYLYIDADAWVQCWDAVETFCAGARDFGFAIASEWHPNYTLSHYWGIEFGKAWFGPAAPGTREVPVNAGVFAGLANAPHWKIWHKRIAEVVERPSFNPNAHFALDQAAINVLLDRDRLPCAYVPEHNNFLCNHGTPRISEDGTLLVNPYPPYQPLGIVHNAGKDKFRRVILKTPSGGQLTRGFTYVSRSNLPSGDYVSPGLAIIILDQCFPNMVKGDPAAVSWPYIRRGISHNWYVDKRDPLTGFINRDEAHILYNTALRFRGMNALEIGCHMGWSACHIAAAGPNLDIVDPILSKQPYQESALASLNLSSPPGEVRLYPYSSPEGVERIAREQNKKWSFFFIDGNHEHPGPLNDVIVAQRYAEPDAMMVFHDLAAPAVAQGLAYLRKEGWNVRIYHTAQIMAVAWRGVLKPVDHEPDHSIRWTIPDHLRQFY